MRYKKANEVFPEHVLKLVQEYVEGQYIYIPRIEENKKCWGDNTGTKLDIRRRNALIYEQYESGTSIKSLAVEHFLSEKSIQRIITLGNKGEWHENEA